jgi:hypothetical protein
VRSDALAEKWAWRCGRVLSAKIEAVEDGINRSRRVIHAHLIRFPLSIGQVFRHNTEALTSCRLQLFTSTRSQRWHSSHRPEKVAIACKPQSFSISSLRNAVQPARCANVYHVMLITPTLSRAVESADARWLQRIANAPQAMACKHRFAALQSKSVIGRHGCWRRASPLDADTPWLIVRHFTYNACARKSSVSSAGR